MDGFTFYKSYYETLKKIRKRTDRAETAFAVLEFMFDGCEPENLSEGGEIAFESFRRTLETSKGRATSASKTKQNQSEIKTETKLKQNESKSKSNESKTETSSSLSYSLSLSTPPLSPPIRVERDAKTVFFETYPALSTKKAKDEGIDYNVLLDEFAKSATLRGMYSFAKVAGLYESIKAGCFRDKVDVVVAAANARSAREKWYADKRAKSEAAADKFREIANGSERFKQIESILAKLNIEMAKAEVYEPRLLKRLKADQKSYQEERLEILQHLGIEEWQLEAQYECDKCKDTGFKADGHMCDCYKG